MGFSLQVEGLQDFAEQLKAATGAGLKKDIAEFLNAAGVEFLRIVQSELKSSHTVVTGNLIGSFGMGGSGNIWEIGDGGFSLTVGSNVEYASYVNDGHFTTPAGVERRFVPGYKKGRRFVYDPSAKGGITLVRKWISGKHYWEAAIRHSEPILQKEAEIAIDKWVAKYFG